jgi:hypothetical protein
MTTKRRVFVIGSSVLALATFACPWVVAYGFFAKVYAGWEMAAPGESMASGSTTLWRLWVCPVAVLFILLLALDSPQTRFHARTQIFLVVVAFIPIPLIIPPELRTWGESSYGWGLVLFCVILAVLLIEAIQRLRIEPTPAST